jgi:hypothetical protein
MSTPPPTKPTPTTNQFPAAMLDQYAERISTGIAMLGGVLMLPALFWYLSGIAVALGILSGILVCVGLALAMAVWLLLGYAAQPVSYRIAKEHLIIKRRWLRSLKTPLKDIAGVAPTGAFTDASRRGVRRALNFGVFGYHGRFQLAPYGQVYLAASNLAKIVAIARPNQPPLLISPDQPRALVDALREVLIKAKEPAPN